MSKIYGYIYKITNNINNKIYIGQTTDSIKRRKIDHLKHLRQGTHYNQHLQNSYNLHGNIFYFEIIDIAYNKEDLDMLEIDYISKYDSTNKLKGYNILIGGRGVRHTPEMKTHKSKLLTKNNPMKRPEIAKKQSETAIRTGCNAGENNGRFIKGLPDNSYFTLLYLELRISIASIANLYNINRNTLYKRLKKNKTVIINKNIVGHTLC